MASNGGDRDPVESLPPSCRYVLAALEDADGTSSRQDLIDQLCHRESTINRALDTLESGNYIIRTRNPSDLREVVVELADERRYNRL